MMYKKKYFNEIKFLKKLLTYLSTKNIDLSKKFLFLAILTYRIMIRKLWLQGIIFLLSSTSVFSQQLSHQVLVPLAGIATDSRISFTQTVGETAVEISGCDRFVFTQGFQQPAIRFTNETAPKGTGIKVYPNPVSDYVFVELYGEISRSFTIDVINSNGTIVMTFKRDFYDQYWLKEPHNTQNLKSGFYLVRVLSDDGLINRTFKIEKI